jgi:hypothetical protein
MNFTKSEKNLVKCLSDKIRFMNRAEIAVPTLVAVGENGEKSRLNAKPKNKIS